MNGLALAEYAAPLLAASAGALAAERSGRSNMALEGLVLAGALAAAASVRWGLEAPLAVPASMALCASAAILFSLFLGKSGADAVISGIAFNALLAGAVSSATAAISGSAGIWRLEAGAGSGGILTFLGLGLVFYAGTWLLLARTRAGLRLRAAGSSELALEAAGADPEASRSLAFALSGAGCGLAGACMALGLGAFSPGMSAGRGWLALASVYAGRKRPGPCLLAVAVFSLADFLAVQAQAWRILPHELTASIAPLAALAAIALSAPRGKIAQRPLA